MVTPGSLRLGLDLSGEENCIGFYPILSDCKVRNPQNLAGSVPQIPTLANILIQKKEQKSLLLKFVIPAGFEPTTRSLEGCCSIQLSYGTKPYFAKLWANAPFLNVARPISRCKYRKIFSISATLSHFFVTSHLENRILRVE